MSNHTRLGDVCRILNGYAFDSNSFVNDGGFPLIRIRDLKTNTPSIGFAGEYDPIYVMNIGNIIVGMDGEFRCYSWQGPPALLNQRLCQLIPNEEVLDKDYLLYWIGEELLRIEEKTAFTTVKHLSSRDLLRLPIALPPLLEQQRIADKIKQQLADISLCGSRVQEQCSLSETLSARILHEQFFDIVPISVRPVDVRHPGGWSQRHLLDLARLESGHTPSRRHPEWWGGNVPWLALPDIRKLHGKYAYETTEYTNDAGLANSSARLLPPTTVCLCRDASIGYVTILGRPMATSQHFCNWICGPDLDAEFLMYAFMASQDYLRELGSGSVLKTIYMPTIQSFQICAPDIEEQRRIAKVLSERLAAAEELTTSLTTRLADIEKLPQRLLAAAFGQA